MRGEVRQWRNDGERCVRENCDGVAIDTFVET